MTVREGPNIDRGKNIPNAEMVVGSMSLQDGVHKTVVSRYNCCKVVVLDGALQHLLASSGLGFTSIFEDSLCCRGNAVLLDVYGLCWVRSDLKRHWHVR